MSEWQKNPYRLFFPSAAALSLAGTVPWILYHLRIAPMYPGLYHADVMTVGFMMAVIAGFLFTATPRFTRTAPPSLLMIRVVALLFVLQLYVGVLQLHVPFLIIATGICVALFGFCTSRIFSSSETVAPGFYMIPVALVQLLFAMGVSISVHKGVDVPASLVSLAKVFQHYGVLLNLLGGIGARVIPAFCGHQPIDKQGSEADGQRRIFIAALVVLNAGLIAQAFVPGVATYLILAFAMGVIAVVGWQIHKPANTPSKLGFWLRVAGSFVVLGLLFQALFPTESMHWGHLVLVNGMGLMAMMVMIRVIVAHGEFDRAIEAKKWVHAAGAFILLAGFTRATAHLIPNSVISHFSYASMMWVIAAGIWFVKAGRLVFRSK
jgi:uncharacterized protein involved in response to NO